MLITPEYYDAEYYGHSDKKKPYMKDGKLEHYASYQSYGPWSGWDYIISAIKKIFDPVKILDVGCGTGSFVHYAINAGLDCTGIDYSQWCIDHPYKKAKGHIFKADALELPFEDSEFDFILCTDMMEHIFWENVQDTINEIYRVCTDTIFFNIACSRDNDPVYKLIEGRLVPEHLQHLAVAGHVTVIPHNEWGNYLIFIPWYEDKDSQEWFRAIMPFGVIQNWIDIFIMRRL